MKNPQYDEIAFFGDILKSIQNIKTYTQTGETEFLASSLIQDAVIRNFEIIGEATKNLSPEFRQRYPDIPWRKMAGFRDVLTHSYMWIDLSNVWKAVTEILALEADLQRVYQSIKPQ